MKNINQLITWLTEQARLAPSALERKAYLNTIKHITAQES